MNGDVTAQKNAMRYFERIIDIWWTKLKSMAIDELTIEEIDVNDETYKIIPRREGIICMKGIKGNRLQLTSRTIRAGYNLG